jgi:predicted ferric reductase
VALGFLVAHPLLLLTRTEFRSLINPVDAPARVLWGWAAMLALLVTIAVSRWRLRIRLNYELWHVTHGVLAFVVTGAALLHTRLVGNYMARGTWKSVAWTVWIVVFMALLAYVRVWKPMWRLRRPWLIADVIEQPGDVVSLELRPERHRGMRFRAGQFAWISISGVPFTFTEHPFSLSSSSARRDHVEFTIKALGDFTSRLAGVRGRRAWLEGPFGNFGIGWDSAEHLVLIAGGIGVTPIMSILRTMVDVGDTRPTTLVYGNKTWDTTVFVDEIETMQDRLDLRVVHVVEQPPPDWDGPTGFISQALLEASLPADKAGVQCYVCGPPLMMAATEKALIGAGVPPRQIHAELFTFA